MLFIFFKMLCLPESTGSCIKFLPLLNKTSHQPHPMNLVHAMFQNEKQTFPLTQKGSLLKKQTNN